MKNLKMCAGCIDSECAYKNNTALVKMNCPAEDIEQRGSTTPITKNIKSRNLYLAMAKIKRGMKKRLSEMHPACFECEYVYVSCFGHTIEEWGKILEEDGRSETEVADGFCMFIVEWEEKNKK